MERKKLCPQGRHGGPAIRYLFRGYGWERKVVHIGVLPSQHPMSYLPRLGERVAVDLTAVAVNDYIQQLQEDYSPKLVREVGGLLLRIVGVAGVGATART